MKHSKQNKMHMLKEKFMTAREWVMDHNKIVMPLVLVVCVLITIVVAVNANHKEVLEDEAKQAAMALDSENASVDGDLQGYALEENAYPEINNIIRTYYDAQASGDIEVISSLNTYLDEIETIRVQELSKYIDSYPTVNVYTKPGLTENTYVAYVYSEVKFTDAEQLLPGMQTYYIGQNENGDYFINDGTYDDVIWKYIKEITLQDDVVDLNNKVVVSYNELLADSEELNEFIAYLKEKINEDVGEILAEAEQAEAESNEIEVASAQEETQTENQPAATTVRATDVVNIRSSNSEEADKVDKAQIGQEFPLLEEKGNGWSKVAYNGGEAYIKSDYLEPVFEEVLVAEGAENEADQENENDSTESNSANETVSGTVTVIESVRVRKSASTDAEALGTVYAGDELELIMKQADGWTKIKYKGQTAFVKSEYVE